MDCKKAEKLLVEYLYQELSPKNTVQLEKHLEVCDACLQTLENWRAIHRGYQKVAEEPTAVPYLKQRILTIAQEELKRKPTFSQRFFTILKPAFILPVLVFGIVATLTLFQTKQSEMAKAPAPMLDQPTTGQSSLNLDKTVGQNRRFPVQPLPEIEKKADVDTRKRNENSALIDQETEEKLRSLGYIDEGNKPSESDRLLAKTEPKSKDAAPEDYRYKQAQAEEPISQPERQDVASMKEASGQLAGATPPAAPPSTAAPKKASVSNANFEKAQSAFSQNELNQGKVLADQAIQDDKSQGKADLASQFHEAGRRYQQNQEPEQAIVQYNLVLNNYPNYNAAPDVLIALAESYEQIGEYDQALKAYQQLARYPSQKNTATQRIGEMQKKQKSRDQLRSLGYTNPEKKD